MQTVVRRVATYAALGAMTAGLIVGAPAAAVATTAGQISGSEEANISQSEDQLEAGSAPETTDLVDEDIVEPVEPENSVAPQDASDASTFAAGDTGNRYRIQLILVGEDKYGSLSATYWEGETYHTPPEWGLPPSDGTYVIWQWPSVNYVKQKASEIAKAHAWWVTVPEPGERGKIILDDPRAGAKNGKCLALSTADVPQGAGAAMSVQVDWKDCTPPGDPKQDFKPTPFGDPIYIWAAHKDDPGLAGNVFVTAGIHYFGGVGTNRNFGVIHGPTGAGTGIQIPHLDTPFGEWIPVTPPKPGGPDPDPIDHGLALKRRHLPDGPSGNNPNSWCANTSGGCTQIYADKEPGDVIHFEYELENTTANGKGPGVLYNVAVKLASNPVGMHGPTNDLTCQPARPQLNGTETKTCVGSYTLQETDFKENETSSLWFSVYGQGSIIGTSTTIDTGKYPGLKLEVRLPPLPKTADLSATKKADQEYVRAGDDISWDVVVTHENGAQVPKFVLEDQLPAEVEYVGIDEDGVTGTAKYDSGTHTLTYTSNTSLTFGQQATITIHGKVKPKNQSDTCVTGEELSNTVTVDLPTLQDSNPANNVATATTPVLCDELELTKVVDGRAVAADDFTVSVFDSSDNELVSASTSGNDQATSSAVRMLPGESYYLIDGTKNGSATNLDNYDAVAECETGIVGLDLDPVRDGSNLRWQIDVPASAQLPDEGISASCTITNTYVEPKAGAISWSKVDPAGNPLEASEWTITPKAAGGNVITVQDCVADNKAECNGLFDQDPNPGDFLVENLEPGDYTLTETKAPAGFQICDECAKGVQFTVVADQVTKVGPDQNGTDPFVNETQKIATLPLTGVSTQSWISAMGGLLIGTLLAVTVWVQRSRREGGREGN
ncbi:SpaA isopeptide-forming pilin-related protein [Actinomycetaceae bacterium MB13-C1-2]|nr:SpaA isopeptide-forming pilin-related protein [Actinomycetaceae bacterium MB13-C1-2]